MRSLIAMYLAFVALLAHADIPQAQPETAIFVTSCHQIVAAIVVMPDGKVLMFDKDSGESADAVKTFAAKSKIEARAYEVGCFKGEEDLHV